MMLKLGVATYTFLWMYSLEATLRLLGAWGFKRVEEIAIKLQEIAYDGTSVIETTYLVSPDGGVRESKVQLEALGWRA